MKYSIAILFFLMLCGLAHGAENVQCEAKFSIVGLGPSLPSDCVFVSEGVADKIGEIAPNYRSKAFEYRGEPEFKLYREDASGALAVYAEVNIPLGNSNLLFVLIPMADTSGERARLLFFDDSTKAFPYGSYRFVNTTPYRIAGLISEKKLLLKSGEMGNVKLDAAQNEYFSVDLRSEQNNVWNPGFSSRWRHRPTTRIMMFLYTDPNRPTSILAQTIPQHTRR